MKIVRYKVFYNHIFYFEMDYGEHEIERIVVRFPSGNGIAPPSGV
jgi:hypothetical protein